MRLHRTDKCVDTAGARDPSCVCSPFICPPSILLLFRPLSSPLSPLLRLWSALSLGVGALPPPPMCVLGVGVSYTSAVCLQLIKPHLSKHTHKHRVTHAQRFQVSRKNIQLLVIYFITQPVGRDSKMAWCVCSTFLTIYFFL